MDYFFGAVAGIICIAAFFFFFGRKLPDYHAFTPRQKFAWNLFEFAFLTGIGYVLYTYNRLPWWGVVLLVCVTPFNLLFAFLIRPPETSAPPAAPEPPPAPKEPTVEEKIEELLNKNKR